MRGRGGRNSPCAHPQLFSLVICVILGLLSILPSAARGEQVRVRIAWGEGQSRRWRGVVRIEKGKILEARGLGLEADSPGAISLSKARNVVEIFELSPHNYNGVDVLVDAPLDSNISVELRSGNDPPKQLAATLMNVVTSEKGHGKALDDQGNRVVMQRSPGDWLRFESQYDSMVFSTGEAVRFQLRPHLLTAVRNAALDLRVRLLQGGEVVDSQLQKIVLGANGSSQAAPFEFTLPQMEGVLEFEFSLLQKARVQWLPSTQVAIRRVQFVAIDTQPLSPDGRSWVQVDTLEPTKKGWFDLARLPGIPGMTVKPINRDATQIRMIDGHSATELPPGGWVAYPLSIPADRMHAPHVLEIEYPTSSAQSFSISLVEPNRANEVTSPSVDSGVMVSDRWADATPKMERHRMMFWPRTSTPFVLIANRSQLATSQFGKIRIYAGPLRVDENSNSLEPSEAPSPYGQGRTAVLDERTVAAFFSRPQFAENFGSDRAADPARPQGSLDDWYKFYRGASRLAQYLRFAGFNTAVVCVAREGGAIYPSKVLGPTPRFDNGVFFRSGQDPLRKDVLEMMFRMFDREGLKLIPALHLSGITPGLERLRQDAARGEGIALSDQYGGSRFDGRRRPNPAPPFYNAIDPRVQEETKRIVREVVERYASHASFGGIALQSGADTWTQFPDESWGMDRRTIQQFATQARAGPWEFEGRADEPARQILGQPALKAKWLRWRADSLARLHRAIELEVERSRPGAKFILTTESMFQSPAILSNLRPHVDPVDSLAERLLRVGYDAQIPRLPGNEMLRPYRMSDESNISYQAENMTLNQPSANDGIFGGAIFHHEQSYLATKALNKFNKQTPFGDARTKLRLNSTLTPSAQDNRRRYARAMAGQDPFVMLDGGSAIAMGQEFAVRPYLRLLRALPAQPFETVPGTRQNGAEPVVVRHYRTAGGTTMVYAVNQAPWETDLNVALTGVVQAATQSIRGVESGGVRTMAAPNQLAWRVQIAPFGVAAIVLPAGAAPAQWTTTEPPRIAVRLERRIQNVKRRIAALNLPRRAAAPPPNLSFEAQGKPVPNWRFPPKDPRFQIETEQDGPSRVLHLKNDDAKAVVAKSVLWSRSDRFPTPITGMVAVEIRLRTKKGDQPRLAVAIDELNKNGGFYEPLFVGKGTPQKVDSDWRDYPFLFKLPPNVDNVAIGFDLHGKGEVWIDDIRIYDIWLQGERIPLGAQSDIAANELVGGNPYGCQRFLEGYWPRFLLQHNPARVPRAAQAVKPQTSPLLKLWPR